MKHVLFAISYQLYHIHFNQFAIYLEPISQLPISHMITYLSDSSPLQVQMFGEKFLKALRDRQLASVLSIEKVLSSWCISMLRMHLNGSQSKIQKRGFLPRGIMALAKRRDRVGSWATSLAWNYSEMLYSFFGPRVLLEFVWDLRSFISAWTITHDRCDQELSCIFRQVLKIYPLCNIDLM